MANSRELIGEYKPDGLIYDSAYPLTTKSVRIRAGQGKLLRGTVLCYSDGTGGDSKYVAISTAALENETLIPDCILADDTDATSAVVSEAYRTGHFASNKVIGTITEKQARTLAQNGILLSELD